MHISATRLFASSSLAASISLGVWLCASAPLHSQTRAESFRGRLLVATEAMKDPRFAATVIYLVKDDNEGAMGLVINRPMTQARVDDLLTGFGAEPKGSDRQITLHYGGPVSTLQGFLLHTDEITVENSINGGDGIAMTSSIKMIEAIADGKGPAEFVFALGYAGWAPGQLHAEITAQAWFVAAADKTLIFGTDAELKWSRALEKRQIPL